MLQTRDLRIAQLLKQRIQTITGVQRFVVFGSRARGTAEQGSDLDCFIEITTVTPEIRKQIYDIAWEVGFEQGFVISIFLASSGLLTDSPLAANPLLRAIELDGVAV